MTDDDPEPTDRQIPFTSVEALRDWLSENVPTEVVISIAKGYTVGDLLADLDAIDDRLWSDGIDAMGEDA